MNSKPLFSQVFQSPNSVEEDDDWGGSSRTTVNMPPRPPVRMIRRGNRRSLLFLGGNYKRDTHPSIRSRRDDGRVLVGGSAKSN